MATLNYTGNSTFLYNGTLLPAGLASDTAVTVTFDNPISQTVIGFDGSIAMGLLQSGTQATITFKVFAGSPLFNFFVALQKNWLSNGNISGTFSVTTMTDSNGGTETLDFIAFIPATLTPFAASNSSVKDSIEREIKFSGVYNKNI
jgi:hypothetical protein